MIRVVLFGAPGVGKGTQGARLANDLGIPAISTGDLFREHIRTRTELGVSVQRIIASGGYVPDVVTNEMVGLRIDERDARAGFVLDGYPRTAAQIEELDRMLGGAGVELDSVVLLEAATTVLIERLTRRAADGGRADDSPEVIQRRLDLYDSETAPLALRYEQRGLLVRVDGVGTQDEVAGRLRDGLGLQRPRRMD